jgi:hypothetical protein
VAKKKLPPSKPRNHLVALARFKRAGAHKKPYKSLRQQQKQQLKNSDPFINYCTLNTVIYKMVAILGIRQVGKAPDFDSGIRWFESIIPSQAPIDQLVEQ